MRVFVCLILIVTFLLNSVPALAHFQGVPFVKINGKLTTIYTNEEGVSIGDNLIPTDIASSPYLVNSEVNFEADPTLLPFPEEITSKAKYTWDFGDGGKAEGLKVKHKYTKIGSHIINLEMDYGDLSDVGFGESVPPQFQQILIHIIPNADYQIPKPVIYIDGKEINTLEKSKGGFFGESGMIEIYDHFNFFKVPKRLKFDASKSSGSSKIVKYEWEFFDDDNPKKGAKINHNFSKDYYTNQFAVRITDENNFYADAFQSVINKDKEDANNQDREDNTPIIDHRVIYGLGFMLLIIPAGGAFVLVKKIRKSKSKPEHKTEGGEN